MSAVFEDQLAILAASPIFRGIPAGQLSGLWERDGCCVQDFPVGSPIYSPDHFSRRLGILLSGKVRVTKLSLTVSILTPGSVFGAAALYNEEPDYAATLTALSPCSALMLEEELLDALLGEYPLLRQNYLRYLTGRIRFLSSRLQSLAADSPEARLSVYLLENMQDGQLLCPATELCRRLNISRASLYRAFDALELAGLIRRSGKTISVPDPAALSDTL